MIDLIECGNTLDTNEVHTFININYTFVTICEGFFQEE